MANPYYEPIDYLANYNRGTDLQAAALQNQANAAQDLMKFGIKEGNDASNDYWRMMTKKQELTDKSVAEAEKLRLEREKLQQKTTADALREANRISIANLESETKKFTSEAASKASTVAGSNKALQAHLEIFKAANHNLDNEAKPLQAAMEQMDKLGIPPDSPDYVKLTESYNKILQRQRETVGLLKPLTDKYELNQQQTQQMDMPRTVNPIPVPATVTQPTTAPKPIDPNVIQKKRERAMVLREQGKSAQEILSILNQEFPN